MIVNGTGTLAGGTPFPRPPIFSGGYNGTMELYEQDRGRIVEIGGRDTVTVTLEENATTGYRWTVDAASGLELLSDRFVPRGSAIGSAGERVFQFRPRCEGEHRLHLRHWRPWEGEASIMGHFEVRIVVK
jgi:inhibitor of cysteine peptidase